MKKKEIGNRTVFVVKKDETKEILSPSEIEMDYRAEKAVEAAIQKAIVCNKPIAKYDRKTKETYMELNGERQYAR